jgi:hypothetical protein
MRIQSHLWQAVLLITVLVFGLSACGGAASTTKVVEVTREVPATVIVTQMIVPTAVPSVAETATPTPVASQTPKPTKGPVPTNTRPPTRTVDPSKPTEPIYYIAIEGCNTSRIHVGDTVWVTINGGANGIRKEPDVAKDNIIAYAKPGDQLKVIGGPVCSYKWILWEVEAADGTKGWTPEGNGKVFWLTP